MPPDLTRSISSNTNHAPGDTGENDGGIGGMHQNAGDAPAIKNGGASRVARSIVVTSNRIDGTHQSGRRIAIIDAIHAHTRVTVAGGVCFSGADEENAGIRGGQRQRADSGTGRANGGWLWELFNQDQNCDFVQTVPLDQVRICPLFSSVAVNPESQPPPPQIRSVFGEVTRAVAREPTSLTANNIEPSRNIAHGCPR